MDYVPAQIYLPSAWTEYLLHSSVFTTSERSRVALYAGPGTYVPSSAADTAYATSPTLPISKS